LPPAPATGFSRVGTGIASDIDDFRYSRLAGERAVASVVVFGFLGSCIDGGRSPLGRLGRSFGRG